MPAIDSVGDALRRAGMSSEPAAPQRNASGTLAEPPRPLMRELPPADPFPVDALGPVLAPAARAIHDRVQAPMAICGQSVLAAATGAACPARAHGRASLPRRVQWSRKNWNAGVSRGCGVGLYLRSGGHPILPRPDLRHPGPAAPVAGACGRLSLIRDDY